jgi:hypothetical protein
VRSQLEPAKSMAITDQEIYAVMRAKGKDFGWRSDGILSRAKLLVGIVGLQDSEGNIKRTQKEIANFLGIEKRVVEFTLQSLVDAGALDRTYGGNVGATYRLRPDWFALADLPHPNISEDEQVPPPKRGRKPNSNPSQSTVETQTKAAKPSKQRTPTKQSEWERAFEKLASQVQTLTQEVLTLKTQLADATKDTHSKHRKPQQSDEIPTTDQSTEQAPQITQPILKPLIDGPTLLAHIDERFQFFAETLVTRIEKALTGRLDTQSAESPTITIHATENLTTEQETAPITVEIDPNIAVDQPTDTTETPAEDPIDRADVKSETTKTQATESGQDQSAGEENQTPQLADDPKRKPGRPPRDLNIANRLEAQADLIFDKLSNDILPLSGMEQSIALLELTKSHIKWHSEAYTDDQGNPAWTTILKRNMPLIKHRIMNQAMATSLLETPIDQLEGNTDALPLIQLVKLWGRTFDSAVEEQTYKLNTEYRENAKLNAINPTPVDITGWLKLSLNTLESVAAGKQVQWEAVSFALALATGRRQAEVHCTAQILKVEHDDPSTSTVAALPGYAVLFAGRGNRPFGQTKTRSGSESEKEWIERPKRVLPTLVSADLVLAGWQYLEDHGQKVEEEELVNRTFNGKLASLIKKVAPGFTYKNLRDFYAICCWRNWLRDGVPETSLPERLKEVLGHGPMGDATASYRKFVLVEESLSRI